MTKTTKQPTTRTVARKLRTLAKQMRRICAEMEYVGGFDEHTLCKAYQLIAVSRMVDTWADGMANKEGGR